MNGGPGPLPLATKKGTIALTVISYDLFIQKLFLYSQLWIIYL